MADDTEFDTWAREWAQDVGRTIEASMQPFNDYVTAPDDAIARRVLNDHPELANPTGMARLDRLIAQAREAGDQATAQQFERRRRLLAGAGSGTHRHRWEETKQTVGRQLCGTETCAECGTGFELVFTPVPDGSVRTALTLLPPAGQGPGQIHPEVVAHALQRREQAVGELRAEGLTVTHSDPRLGRPGKAPTANAPAPTGPSRRSRTPLIAAGAVIAVLIVIGAVFALQPTARPAGGASAAKPITSAAAEPSRAGGPTTAPTATTAPPTIATGSTTEQPTSGATTATTLAGPGGRPTATGGGPTAAAPAMPTNVSVTALDAHTIRIRWSDKFSDESGFEVNNGTQTRSVGANSIQYDWSGLSQGTYMCFRVRAKNATGTSAFAPSASPYYKCATTLVDTMPPPPSYVYPVDGQTLDFSGSYLFKVTAVPGAAGYLFGFFQDGAKVWENLANEGTLSSTEYGIMQGSTAHDQFHAGDVQVWVRASVGGQWTDARIITIHLA